MKTFYNQKGGVYVSFKHFDEWKERCFCIKTDKYPFESCGASTLNTLGVDKDLVASANIEINTRAGRKSKHVTGQDTLVIESILKEVLQRSCMAPGTRLVSLDASIISRHNSMWEIQPLDKIIYNIDVEEYISDPTNYRGNLFSSRGNKEIESAYNLIIQATEFLDRNISPGTATIVGYPSHWSLVGKDINEDLGIIEPQSNLIINRKYNIAQFNSYLYNNIVWCKRELECDGPISGSFYSTCYVDTLPYWYFIIIPKYKDIIQMLPVSYKTGDECIGPYLRGGAKTRKKKIYGNGIFNYNFSIKKNPFYYY